MKTYQLRIDGRLVDPAVGKWFDAQTPNPQTWGARIPRTDKASERALQTLWLGVCGSRIFDSVAR